MSILHVAVDKLTTGELTPPLSKSDAHRALVLGHVLGHEVDLGTEDALPNDVRVIRAGLASLARGKFPVEIDCADGGAPYRFLIGQAAVTPNAHVRFVGTRRLGDRPHQALVLALREALGSLGLEILEGEPWPVVVRAPQIPQVSTFRVSGEESSQYVSSLLLSAAALVHRYGLPVAVELTGRVASAGYLDMTLQWIQRAGFELEAGSAAITLRGFSDRGPLPPVPGDWSSLGYLLPLAWKSGATVRRVDLGAVHPDKAIVRHLAGAGIRIDELGDGRVRVNGTPSGGITASASECPDLIPTLAAVACILPATSTFSNVEILRAKESDRLEGICTLVHAAGGEAVLGDNATLTVRPPRIRPTSLRLGSQSDHRMAMCAALLAVLTGAPLRLEGAECVEKSFPTFWQELEHIGVRTAPE